MTVYGNVPVFPAPAPNFGPERRLSVAGNAHEEEKENREGI